MVARFPDSSSMDAQPFFVGISRPQQTATTKLYSSIRSSSLPYSTAA